MECAIADVTSAEKKDHLCFIEVCVAPAGTCLHFAGCMKERGRIKPITLARDCDLRSRSRKNTIWMCVQVFTHREDCSKELLEWGSRVAAANSRAPNPPR